MLYFFSIDTTDDEDGQNEMEEIDHEHHVRFDRTVVTRAVDHEEAELAVDNPKTKSLIDLEHVDDYEGLATRVIVHETIRSN